MPDEHPRRPLAATLWPIAAVSAAVGLFYALPFVTRPLRVPVADDTFFYVWAIRFIGSFGLADSHIAARPAFPLFGSTTGALTHVSPWIVAVATPVTMAVGLALAGGAIAMRWGLSRRAPLFAILVGASAVVARLVAGKTENLLTLWLIAAIVAASLWGEGRRRFWGIVALSLAAALTEWPFVVAFLGLAGAALVWNQMSPTTGDDHTLESMIRPTLLGLSAGLAVVFLWNGSGFGSAIQQLPPDFAYRRRLSNEIAYVWPQLTVSLTLAGWWISRNPRGEGERSMMHLLTLWLLVTGVTLAVGFLGLELPTYRAITFALPVALATGAAPFVVTRVRRGLILGRRMTVLVGGTALTVAALIPGTALWYRDLDGRASLDQISAFATVVEMADRLPADRPPIVVVNRRVDRADFYGRLAETLLPPDHRRDVLIFMGTSEDAVAGRPTLGHGADRDALTRQLFKDVAPALSAGAPLLTAPSLDYPGFQAAAARGAQVIAGGDVAVLRGPIPSMGSGRTPIVPISRWWEVFLVAMGALAASVLAGTGWTNLMLPRAPALARAMVSPALGVTSLVAVSLVLIHLGVRPVGAGAAATVAVAVAISAAAAASRRIRPPRIRIKNRSRVRRPAAAAVTALVVLVAGAAGSEASSSPVAPAGGGSVHTHPSRPNLVVILTDDQRWDTMSAMPNVRSLLGGHGVTFVSSFVTTSLCCPSRAGLLTGRYSRNLGVYGDLPPGGGAVSFDDSSTVATWLHHAGYTTGFVGKYLNDYQAISRHIPPGWDQWAAIASQPTSRYQGYTLNENGRFVQYGLGPRNYSTTVLGGIASRFLQTATPPFFLHFAPIAPHGPATPASQDANRVEDLFTDWPPSFDEADVSDKPWARLHPPLTPAQIRAAGAMRERMLRSLAAVDRAVGEMVRVLASRHELENTVIVFTSDNGYLLGEHRLRFQKIWPYEESIRVPLVIRTPWTSTARVDRHLVLNIDVAPTLAELAGVVPEIRPDGRSLVPLLKGRDPPWRTAFVEEFLGRDQRFRGGPPPFVGVRTERYLFVIYRPGWRELYDLATDPYQVHNLAGQPSSLRLQSRLREVLQSLLASNGRAPPPRSRIGPLEHSP